MKIPSGMADEAPPEDAAAAEQPPKEPQLPLPLTAENPATLLMTLQVLSSTKPRSGPYSAAVDAASSAGPRTAGGGATRA